LPSTGISALDQIIGGKGYPDKSAILIIGPPGIGKEALGYYFMKSGMASGDFCLYATRLPVSEVLHDGKAFGWDDPERKCFWIAREGGDSNLDLRNLAGIHEVLRETLSGSKNRRVRIVLDFASPLLVLYPTDIVYSFLNQILGEIKKHDAVLLATVELGMHNEQAMVSLQTLFDGFLEMRYYGIGLNIVPMLRMGKMRGTTPSTGYFRFGFVNGEITVEPAEGAMRAEKPTGESELLPTVEGETEIDLGQRTDLVTVFNYLVSSFIDDYATSRYPAEKSGWRSRGSIIESTKLSKASFYGALGKYGPLMGELMSRGLVETCFFPGERGRGGEIVKLRIAYEKASVRALVQNSLKGDEGK